MSYEVESPKEAAPINTPKESIVNRLTSSKRMLITIVVFMVLVFVAYKMVAPTSTAPATDIVPPPVTVAQQNPASAKNPAPAMSMQAPPATAAASTPVMPANSPASPPPVVMVQATPAPQAPTVVIPAPAQTAAAPQPVMANAQPATQSIPPAPLTPPQQMQSQPPAISMPAVIPVQSVTPAMNQSPQMTSGPGTGGSIDAKMAELAAENQKLIGMLETEYTQKMNDFQTQNKNLTDQVQTLNSRVASMETQMNQLVQALTRQVQSGSAANVTPAQPQPAIQPKIPYNVQAIIPGRAWLKSDSGETVTVAEGDSVKDLGRVTKIDPYNGVVEIDTGSKVVSLSYGNGG